MNIYRDSEDRQVDAQVCGSGKSCVENMALEYLLTLLFISYECLGTVSIRKLASVICIENSVLDFCNSHKN